MLQFTQLLPTRVVHMYRLLTVVFLLHGSGFFNALIRIPREEGFLAMYKGLPARLLRIAPGQAIVWTVNDQIVGFFEKRQREQAAATPAV